MNLIPSENTPSRAVRLLSGSDPACRYAEHKKILAFYEKEVFYYQGTKFIDQVERMLAEEMRPISAAPRWRPGPSAARCPTWRCSPR